MKSVFYITIITVVIMLQSFALPSTTIAQSGSTRVSCGDSIDVEFTKSEIQEYTIQLNARDVLTVQGEAVGNTLTFVVFIYDPVNQQIGVAGPAKAPMAKTEILSANGIYTVKTANNGWGAIGVGLYNLKFICTGRASANPTATPGSNPITPTPNSVPTATNLLIDGFRGVPSVSYANAITDSLRLGNAIIDAIAPTGEDVKVYTFTGKANQNIQINLRYIRGNLSLGMALTGPNQETIAASIISKPSSQSSTQIVLEKEGEYRLGVFRLEHASIQRPQATTFEIMVK